MEEEKFIIPEINLEDLGIEKNSVPDHLNEGSSNDGIDDGQDVVDEPQESDEDGIIEEEAIHAPVYNWMKDSGFFFNKKEEELKDRKQRKKLES